MSLVLVVLFGWTSWICLFFLFPLFYLPIRLRSPSYTRTHVTTRVSEAHPIPLFLSCGRATLRSDSVYIFPYVLLFTWILEVRDRIVPPMHWVPPTLVFLHFRYGNEEQFV